MGTNCNPLVADLFLFCYESDFTMSLFDYKQADIIEAFNTTLRYLDNILKTVYFDIIVSQIYIFSWWCSSLYIQWSLYLSLHSFC